MGLLAESQKGLRRLRPLIVPSALLLAGIALAVAVIGYLDTRSSVDELDNRATDLRVQLEALVAAESPDSGALRDDSAIEAVASLQGQIDDLDRQVSGLQATMQRPEPVASDWIVIEKQQSDITDERGVIKQTLTLRYNTPHGGTASWEGEVFWTETPDGSGAQEMHNEHFLDCWSNARVGESLPSCARR